MNLTEMQKKDPGATGRLVVLLSLAAATQYPRDTPEVAVRRMADDMRVALGAEAQAAAYRAGGDAFAQEQLALAIAEMVAVMEIAEPLAVDELRAIRGRPETNPSTPEGQAALYAWLGHLIGYTGGAIIGALLGTVAAAGGALGSGVAIAGLGGYVAGIVGARYGAARATKVSEKELRETKNYATFGAVLMPWFGLGPAFGAYLGAKPNPESALSVEHGAVQAILSTQWPPELVDAWRQTSTTAGDMAEAVMVTARAAGWTAEQIRDDPRTAIREAVGIWEAQPIETGWGEFPEYTENPSDGFTPAAARRKAAAAKVVRERRKRESAPVELEVVLASGARLRIEANQVTDSLVIHPSLRNLREIELGQMKKAKSWGITHAPTGALIATVPSKAWAKMLAKEIQTFSGPGIRSADIRTVSEAIGGPGGCQVRYIRHIQRQASEPSRKRGKFVGYRTWSETCHELDHNPADTADSVRSDAAVSAAIGSLVGGLAGGILGAVVLGGVGVLSGAAGAGIVGATFGIPLGGYVGTIWGAVRQTGKAMGDDPNAGPAKVGAGLGSAFFGPLGAGAGAYVGAS